MPIPCLGVRERGYMVRNIAVHPNKCVLCAFGRVAIFNPNTELYLLKNTKEQSSTSAPLTVSTSSKVLCTLLFYLFLFHLFFF